MLGLQNTRTGGDLPTRTYRCVACAATFPGLSSLLVHQASHANDANPLDKLQLPPSSPGISCTHCSIAFASKELMNKHHCGAFPTVSSSFICECGENFQHQGALLDHKRLHKQDSNFQVQGCSVEEKKSEAQETISSLCDQTNPASDQGPISGSDSDPPHLQLIPLLTDTATAPGNKRKGDISEPASLQTHFNEVALVPGKLTPMSQPVSQPVVFGVPPALSAPQNEPSLFGSKVMGPFVPSKVVAPSISLPLPQELGLQQPKKTLKKMLFSEFMKRLPPAQISWNPTKLNTSSGNIVSTVAGVDASPASSSGTSVRQLRKLLARSAAKRKASSQASAILNLISSSKTHTKKASYLVSLSRSFLPVVALETRQKLLGSGKDVMEGRHQCGRCRKIFQDVDGLILHHAVHRKERINGCRHCGLLLIGKLAIPENHLCPQTSMLSAQDIFSVGILLSSPSSTHAHSNRTGSMAADPLQGTTPIPNTKKNYHCFLCNQSYTRLYSLKKHQCLGMTSILKAAASQKRDGVHSLATGMKTDGELQTVEPNEMAGAELKQNEAAGDEMSVTHKSIAVGTAGPRDIKLEAFDVQPTTGVISSHCLKAESPHVRVSPDSTKTFISFLNSAQSTPSKTVPLHPASGLAPVLQSILEEDNLKSKMPSGDAQKGKGKWTMPIDDSEIDQLIEAEDADDDDEGQGEGVMESIEKSTDSTQNQNSALNLPFQGIGKCFTCSNCGRGYTRRFTLHQHLKKCHPGVRPVMQQQNIRRPLKVGKPWEGKQSFDCLQCGRSFCYRDTLVLHQKNCQPRNSRGDGERDHIGPKNKNSLSLGQDHLASQGRLFVLPPSTQARGSRAPENKKQAMGKDWGIMSLPSVLPRKVTCECGEGFTCPRLLFEHLQLHAQESYICPDCGENLPSWPVFEAHLRKHQRSACQNCNQTFSHRYSLVRHLRKNRCKGNTMMAKKHCCPRCKLDLPNALSLKLHMQSPPCKPSRKLIRCPVCARAFGGVEELQRHLIAHTHPNAFRCQLCQRSYPSLVSLKDHRRKVHKMKKNLGQERMKGVAVL